MPFLWKISTNNVLPEIRGFILGDRWMKIQNQSGITQYIMRMNCSTNHDVIFFGSYCHINLLSNICF